MVVGQRETAGGSRKRGHFSAQQGAIRLSVPPVVALLWAAMVLGAGACNGDGDDSTFDFNEDGKLDKCELAAAFVAEARTSYCVERADDCCYCQCIGTGGMFEIGPYFRDRTCQCIDLEDIVGPYMPYPPTVPGLPFDSDQLPEPNLDFGRGFFTGTDTCFGAALSSATRCLENEKRCTEDAQALPRVLCSVSLL